jgi:5'(3')-deoxyribonucleotidase
MRREHSELAASAVWLSPQCWKIEQYHAHDDEHTEHCPNDPYFFAMFRVEEHTKV